MRIETETLQKASQLDTIGQVERKVPNCPKNELTITSIDINIAILPTDKRKQILYH